MTLSRLQSFFPLFLPPPFPPPPPGRGRRKWAGDPPPLFSVIDMKAVLVLFFPLPLPPHFMADPFWSLEPTVLDKRFPSWTFFSYFESVGLLSFFFSLDKSMFFSPEVQTGTLSSALPRPSPLFCSALRFFVEGKVFPDQNRLPFSFRRRSSAFSPLFFLRRAGRLLPPPLPPLLFLLASKGSLTAPPAPFFFLPGVLGVSGAAFLFRFSFFFSFCSSQTRTTVPPPPSLFFRAFSRHPSPLALLFFFFSSLSTLASFWLTSHPFFSPLPLFFFFESGSHGATYLIHSPPLPLSFDTKDIRLLLPSLFFFSPPFLSLRTPGYRKGDKRFSPLFLESAQSNFSRLFFFPLLPPSFATTRSGGGVRPRVRHFPFFFPPQCRGSVLLSPPSLFFFPRERESRTKGPSLFFPFFSPSQERLDFSSNPKVDASRTLFSL